MAFLKKGFSSEVTKPGIQPNEWLNMTASEDSNLKVSKKLITAYSPEKYLLSHCTIIASVDTEKEPVNSKGWQYYITPNTSKYVNSNQDSWDRPLLKVAYKTFVGAENYIEHIQIPALSKGKIIDAVARNLGESLYVDILVATDRKHRDLISSIENGQMSTLSMGCEVEFTICSKCGQVAADEVQLCNCIRYEKGNSFIDKNGKKRIIAELCGHFSDPKSCRFKESSWVKNPAFAGAVLRNILTVEEVANVEQKLATALNTAIEEFDPTKYSKVASKELSSRLALLNQNLKEARSLLAEEKEEDASKDEESDPDKDQAGDAEETGPAADSGEAEDTENKDAEVPSEDQEVSDASKVDMSDFKEVVKYKLLKDLKQDIFNDLGIVDTDEQQARMWNPGTTKYDFNDMMIRSSTDFAQKYASTGLDSSSLEKIRVGIKTLKKYGFDGLKRDGYSGKEALAIVSFIDRMKTSSTLKADGYRAIIKLGGTKNFQDPKTYLAACQLLLGRKISKDEAENLITKGQIYSKF